MSVWGSEQIRSLIEEGYIEKSSPEYINPASINLRLGKSFIRIGRRSSVRLGDKLKYEHVPIRRGFVRLKPGEFMLATTMERVTIPKSAAAFVQGRSSIGRAGLSVQNAGFVDPGFHGHITLELKNDSPNAIMLPVGYPVVQLIFMSATDVGFGYCGKYQGQEKATGSRMYMDKASQ